MLAKMTEGLDFQSKALVLRAERQRILSSNIANVDTPGYAGRDFDFKQALADATGTSSGLQRTALALTPSSSGGGNSTDARPGFIPLATLPSSSVSSGQLAYTVQSQPAMDGNSVDLDRERANFVDNAVRYEATLRFLNGQAKTMLSAIQGQ
jgi:flagellar basal-body rod protein FlgB